MEMRKKNQKGIMLTLATVVLFVLMLAELVAYVSLNINYNLIVSSSSAVSGGATDIATLNSASSAFLHQSLQNALSSLIQYESAPSLRKGHFVNNTAYALQSLMYNGTIPNGINGASFNSLSQSQAISAKSVPLSSNAPFSISLWYKGAGTPTSAGVNGVPAGLVSGSSYSNFVFGLSSAASPRATIWFDAAPSSCYASVNVNPTLTQGTLYHLVAIYDGSNVLTVYVNGAYAGAASLINLCGVGSSWSQNTQIAIGASPPFNWGGSASGQISDLQIYNIALTANQIASLYASGASGTPIIPANTVGWWPLNGDTTDYSSNGNAATPTNVLYNGTAPYTSSAMLNSTFSGFRNRIISQISNEGFNISLTNGTLSVFQSSPFTISANYTALAVVNSTRGLFSFPLAATSSIALNGTQSLYGIETGDPFIIKSMASYPKPVLVGNAFAISGSATTTLFSYGTAYYVPGAPSCASVPSQYQNANYILVTPNAASISSTICGMGGLVTNTLNSPAATVPYLVYPSSSNVINSILTGTSLLLSVQGLSLLNMYGLQSAIQNGYSFASPYVPAYLGWAQGSLTQRSPNGMFSFNLLNRMLASFTGSSYISTNTIGLPSGSRPRSAFAWVYFTGSPSSGTYVVESYGASSASTAAKLGITSGNLYFSGNSNDFTSTLSVAPNSYHLVGYTYTPNTVTLYLDGSSQTGTLSSSLSTTLTTAGIGADAPSGNINKFSGQITDVQIYSTALAPSQAAQLYQEGIDSIPINNAGLVGWWPLNGDFNDYSGQGNNGIATSVSMNKLNDYRADPIWGGSLYGTNSMGTGALSVVEGVMNCGSTAQCTSSSLEHLYTTNAPLTGTYSSTSSEPNAFGIASAIIAASSSCSGSGTNTLNIYSSLTLTAPGSVTVTYAMYGGGGGAGASNGGSGSSGAYVSSSFTITSGQTLSVIVGGGGGGGGMGNGGGGGGGSGYYGGGGGGGATSGGPGGGGGGSSVILVNGAIANSGNAYASGGAGAAGGYSGPAGGGGGTNSGGGVGGGDGGTGGSNSGGVGGAGNAGYGGGSGGGTGGAAGGVGSNGGGGGGGGYGGGGGGGGWDSVAGAGNGGSDGSAGGAGYYGGGAGGATGAGGTSAAWTAGGSGGAGGSVTLSWSGSSCPI
jgi:Concanavalin A-like lectin/glucanases superfamily